MLRRHSANDLSGSRHFVTTVTDIRGNWFHGRELCEAVLTIFEECRAKAKLYCVGYALMPDHIHSLLIQNDESSSVSEFMQDFKVKTAFRCLPEGYPQGNLWRRRYDDVPLPGPKAVQTRLRYMHENPVKAGLVGDATEYEWSSAQFYFQDKPSIIELLPPTRS